MALIGIKGKDHAVNTWLITYAIRHTPSLVLDCANHANPHCLPIETPLEALQQTYVVNIDLIYMLRDILLHAPYIARRRGAQCVIITTFRTLFHYSDKDENKDIYEHAWELMAALGEEYDVIVGIRGQEEYAQKHCDRILEGIDGAHRLEPTHRIRHHPR
ncbi:MAG: hypothetical protein ABIH41_06900 [Nanoarchaeota archaeon]